jgi:hypothetical protein
MPRKASTSEKTYKNKAGAKAPKGPREKIERDTEERIEFVQNCLARYVLKSEIKKAVRQKFGEVSHQSIENYLSRARARILAGVNSTREELKAESVAFYRAVLSDPNSTTMERLKAQQRLDNVFGINAPVKVAQTDTDGKDISPDEARSRLASLARELSNRIGASGGIAGGPGAESGSDVTESGS